jgi:pilus assembly protein CpaB
MIDTRRYATIALASAIVAGVLFVAFLQRIAARATSRAAERTEVVLMSQPAAVGQVLTEEMLAMRAMPPGEVPTGALSEMQDAIGRPAAVDLYAGEILIKDRVGRAAALTAAGAVDAGRVAFGLPVKPHASVGGLIAPGDRVDVISRTGPDTEAPSEIILSDVRVVGIAGEPPFAPPQSAAVTPTPAPANAQRVIILDLDPAQAVVVAHALETSAVYVALRSSQP